MKGAEEEHVLARYRDSKKLNSTKIMQIEIFKYSARLKLSNTAMIDTAVVYLLPAS
jgi:hypothetical protein